MTLAGTGLAPRCRSRLGGFRARGAWTAVFPLGDRRTTFTPLRLNAARCRVARKTPMKSFTCALVQSQCHSVSQRRSCPAARIPCFAGFGAHRAATLNHARLKQAVLHARCIAASLWPKSRNPNKTRGGAGVPSQCHSVSLSAFPPSPPICAFSNRQTPRSGNNREKTHDADTSTSRGTTRAPDGGMDQPP